MHNEVDCITRAVGMHRAIIDAACERPWGRTCSSDPETELRTRLPWMLGRLSPEARALLADQWDHVAELVAFMHRISSRVETGGPK